MPQTPAKALCSLRWQHPLVIAKALPVPAAICSQDAAMSRQKEDMPMLLINAVDVVGAGCWNGSAPAGKAIPWCASGNGCVAYRSRGNGVGTTGADGIDVSAGVCGSGMLCGGCTRRASAGYDDLGVLGTGSACVAGNVSTVRGICFRGRGEASIGVRGKKSSRGGKLDGACC